ncbi:hypothetical protein J2Z58_001853 [Halobacillus andaensis]|nr:hypothetical protein [Halobacillus andaensis]
MLARDVPNVIELPLYIRRSLAKYFDEAMV